MGPAIAALGDVKTFVAHNPIILAIGIVTGVVLSIVRLIHPLVTLLVAPLLIGGLLATIWAGRNGNAGVDDFVGGAKENFLSLLGGYVLLFLAMMGAGLVAAIVSLVPMFVLGFSMSSTGAGAGAGAGGVGAGGPMGGTGMLASFGLFFVAMVVIYALVFLVIVAMAQLFDVAIVVEDRSALGGYNRAWELFKKAPLSLLGYSFLRWFVTFLIVIGPLIGLVLFGAGVGMTMGVGGGAASQTGLQALGLAIVAALVLYVFVLLPLGFVFMNTYQVAYFNRLTAAVE